MVDGEVGEGSSGGRGGVGRGYVWRFFYTSRCVAWFIRIFSTEFIIYLIFICCDGFGFFGFGIIGGGF